MEGDCTMVSEAVRHAVLENVSIREAVGASVDEVETLPDGERGAENDLVTDEQLEGEEEAARVAVGDAERKDVGEAERMGVVETHALGKGETEGVGTSE